MRLTVTIAATIWILTIAADVLRPLAVAILVWIILSVSAERIVRLLPKSMQKHAAVARLASVSTIALILFGIGLLVAEAAAEVRASLPIYEANLDWLLVKLQDLIGKEEEVRVLDILGRIDFRAFALDVASSTAAFGAMFFIVILYVIFVFVETRAFDDKLRALAQGPAEERRLRRVASSVKRAIDDVLGVQVFVGALQAIPTFAILVALDVDGAALWATLAFMFSFIPTIGTIFGIAVPALMTLVQFMALWPFLAVLGLVGLVQIYGTNVLLPRLMSRSLNISALAVLVAVIAGGALWGIVGALIAVPVLSIAMIVCAEVPSLRPVAVLLSARGEIPILDPDGPEDAPLADRRTSTAGRAAE